MDIFYDRQNTIAKRPWNFEIYEKARFRPGNMQAVSGTAGAIEVGHPATVSHPEGPTCPSKANSRITSRLVNIH